MEEFLFEQVACIARLTRRGGGLRTALGREAEVGGFIGRPDQWRRVSEVWVDPDLSDPELPWEVATRLTDYVLAIEPLRMTTPAGRSHSATARGREC